MKPSEPIFPTFVTVDYVGNASQAVTPHLVKIRLRGSSGQKGEIKS